MSQTGVSPYLYDDWHAGFLESVRLFLHVEIYIMGSISPENTPCHPYQTLAIDARVKRVLRSIPLFDTHNDLPQQPRACFHGQVHNNPKFDLRAGFQRGITNIPRLREGAVGAQFWSICAMSAKRGKLQHTGVLRYNPRRNRANRHDHTNGSKLS
jgi:hypothetical protein